MQARWVRLVSVSKSAQTQQTTRWNDSHNATQITRSRLEAGPGSTDTVAVLHAGLAQKYRGLLRVLWMESIGDVGGDQTSDCCTAASAISGAALKCELLWHVPERRGRRRRAMCTGRICQCRRDAVRVVFGMGAPAGLAVGVWRMRGLVAESATRASRPSGVRAGKWCQHASRLGMVVWA
jgi:hypothetical protein